jgi:hypothetical protein
LTTSASDFVNLTSRKGLHTPKESAMSVFSRSIIYALAMLTVGACVLLHGAGHASQEHERVVDKDEFDNAPVSITAVKTKKGFVEVGKKFSDEEDWLRSFTVRVKNTSGKNVSYVSVMVIFPRPKGQEGSEVAPFGDSIRYGGDALSSPSVPGGVPVIPPDETVDITWSERSYDANLLLLEKLKYPKSLKKVRVYVEEVGFQDGTVWSGGRFFKRDPDDPKRLIPLEQAAKAPRPLFF